MNQGQHICLELIISSSSSSWKSGNANNEILLYFYCHNETNKHCVEEIHSFSCSSCQVSVVLQWLQRRKSPKIPWKFVHVL